MVALLLAATGLLTLRPPGAQPPAAPPDPPPDPAPWNAPHAAARGAANPTTGQRPAAPPADAAAAFVPDRVLVGFADGVPRGRRARALQAVGGRATGDAGGMTVVELAAGSDVDRAVAALVRVPGVAYAEPDHYRTLDACDGCWQLGPRPGVNAAPLHASGRVGEGVVVAVLDDGVAADLPELAGRVLQRRACDTRCTTDTQPAGGHGSAVAALIAAADDGRGTTGVAPAAGVKSWRVQSGGRIPTSAVVAALAEVTADPEVTVANMSFSGPVASEAERRAVRAAMAAGKTLVGSAGNDGGYQPQYPAGYQGVLSVGAVDASGAVPAFASYGKLDVVAPGACVPVAVPRVPSSEGCPAAAAGVAQVTGTSFSAPLVTGVLALRSSGSALRDRLGLEGTAAGQPDDPAAAKLRGHGLVDAAAWEASFAVDAEPYLVLEAAEQLPHPDTTLQAYLVTSPDAASRQPDGFAPSAVRMAAGSAPVTLEETEAGVFRATAGTGTLPEGFQLLHATTSANGPAAATQLPAPPRPPATASRTPAPEVTPAPTPTVTPAPARAGTPASTTPTPAPTPPPAPAAPTPGTAPAPAPTTTPVPVPSPAVTPADPAPEPREPVLRASVPVRVLGADDQAPGVPLGAGRPPWTRTGHVRGGGTGGGADHDLDDVYAVRLAAGDTIEATLRPTDPAIGLALFAPGTTDVLGQLGNIVADGLPGRRGVTLVYTATRDGMHLLDVYAPGIESGRPGAGDYRLTATVTRRR